jgi:hypothetical protein
VVEGRLPGVERNDISEEEGIVDHGEVGVLLHPGRVARLDTGEVELATHQCRQLGHRFVHDGDDEAIDVRRPAERGGKGGIALEDPAAIGLVTDETKGAIADRVLVPAGLTQAIARDGV